MGNLSQRNQLLVNSRRELKFNINMSTAEGSVHEKHESDNMELRSCEQCSSTNISVEYIKVQDLMHCICTRCTYEWVE